jgi:hypothetical protein
MRRWPVFLPFFLFPLFTVPIIQNAGLTPSFGRVFKGGFNHLALDIFKIPRKVAVIS